MSGESTTPRLRAWEVAVLAAIVIVVVGLDLSFAHLHHGVPQEDAPARLLDALGFHHRGLGRKLPYPPLAFLVTDLAFTVFGQSIEVARGSMALFHALYLVGMFWLGRSMSGRLGAVAVALGAAGMPAMAQASRTYLTDVPQVAMVALAMAALVASHGFRRVRPTVALGVFLGLGMLARWSFLFFVIAPVMGLGVIGAGADRASRPVVGATCAMVALSAAVVGAIARLEPGLWTTLAVTAVVYVGWLSLLWWAAERRRDPDTGSYRPGVGFALAVAVGNLVCLWWYALVAASLRAKWSLQLEGWAGVAPSLRLSQAVAQVSALGFGAWLLLGAGLVAAVVVPRLRGPTVLLLAGALVGGAMHVWLTPGTPRYTLPALALLVALAFGWAGLSRPVGGLLALVATVVGVAQTGWWHPVAAGVLADSTQSGRMAPRLPLGLRSSFVVPWEGGTHVPLGELPVTLPPDPERYDLLPVLRTAAARTVEVTAARLDVAPGPGTWFEERIFALDAAMADVNVRVYTQDERDPQRAEWVILIAGYPLASERTLRDAPWVRDLAPVQCEQSEAAAGFESSLYWCLCRNQRGVPGGAKSRRGPGLRRGSLAQ